MSQTGTIVARAAGVGEAADTAPPDPARRRMLTLATAGVGAVGTGFLLWPFLASLKPSARAEAAGAPVEVDLGLVEAGQQLTKLYRGKAVWIINRTPAMVASLKLWGDALVDPDSKASKQPDYARNATRSVKPEYAVIVGSCTHLGCVPAFRPDTPAPDIMANWHGGFYCPCHGSKFDLAGRVIKGSPAPVNLVIPDYSFATATRLVIGTPAKA